MKSARATGFKWICSSVRTGSRKRCDCRSNTDRRGGFNFFESCRREEEKKMNRNFWLCSLVGSALALNAGAALAQEAAPPPPPLFMLEAAMPQEGGPPEAF